MTITSSTGPKGGVVPLSMGQQGIVRTQKKLGVPSLNQHLVVRFHPGPYPADWQARLLRAAQDRNDAFRARVVPRGASDRGLIFDPAEEALSIEIVDPDRDPAEWRLGPFPEGTPMARACFGVDGDDRRLDLVLDHLTFDGWSMGLLTVELAEILEHLRHGSPVTRQPGSFEDYLLAHARAQTPESMEAYRQFWSAQFARDSTLELGRARGDDAGSYRLEFDIPPIISDWLPRARRTMKTTDFCVYLSALATVLTGQSGQRSLLIGSAVADRSTRESLDTVGCLQHSVAVRVEVGSTFADTVRSCSQGLVAAMKHQRGPFFEVDSRLDGPTVFAQPRLYAGDSWQPKSAPSRSDWSVVSCPPPPGDITFEFRQAPWGHAGALEYTACWLTADDAAEIASGLLAHLLKMAAG